MSQPENAPQSQNTSREGASDGAASHGGGDWFDAVPKIELHIHLEGAIPMPAMWQLIQKYGGSADTPTPEALDRRFQFTDFDHFLATWMWKNQYIRELADFELIGAAVAADLRAQNVIYAEAFYSPPDFAATSMSVGDITTALRSGIDRVPDIEIALIADVVRNYGPERALRTVEEIAEVTECGVIGIGIGGAEAPFPPELFRDAFARARSLDLRTTAHAGEVAGPRSIWGALHALQVERIGHGTRAHEDPALLDHLADRQIPLEMCPISNVRTGVVASLADHPIRMYKQRGLLVTINTDDPAMFQTSLAHEYRELCRVHEFERADILAFIADAVAASWLADEKKSSLHNQLATFTGPDPAS